MFKFHVAFKSCGILTILLILGFMYLYSQPPSNLSYAVNHIASSSEFVPQRNITTTDEPSQFDSRFFSSIEYAQQTEVCDNICSRKNSLDNTVFNVSDCKIVIIGASTFTGLSIALQSFKKGCKVFPIETEDVKFFTSTQKLNWDMLLSENLHPLVVKSDAELSSLLKESTEIIFLPRQIHDSASDSGVYKEEGVWNLQYFVQLLEVVKHQQRNIRVTLITRPEYKSTSMQSAWLACLEASLKTYHSLYQVRIAFIMMDAVNAYENNEVQIEYAIRMEHLQPLLDKVEYILLNSNSVCLNCLVTLQNLSIALPSKEKNIYQKNVVMSTYFTTTQNPQYAITIRKNNFLFMQDWLVSANRLGITAIVFHDSLSDAFIARIKSEFDNVVFEKVSGFKGRTPNDYRFYLQLEYLNKHPEINHVILSDIRDVVIYNDPFKVMDVIGNYIYVGVDVSYYTSSWSHSYPRGLINACYRKEANSITVTSDPFYNAGVIGATRQLMLKYLKHVTASLDKTPHMRNCNMATIAIVTHKYFTDQSFSGYPFQSAFKMDIPGPQGLAIKHKIEHKNL